MLGKFPSPEERERIVRRREELSNALYLQPTLQSVDPQAAAKEREKLIREYGAAEVQRMLDRIRRQLSRPTGDVEEPWLYDEYVALHRRFGGSRPLLSMQQQRALNRERTALKIRQDFDAGGQVAGPLGDPRGGSLSPAEERRLAELDDLLLADADLWDDLVPEDPPPSPVGAEQVEPSVRQQVKRLSVLVAEGDKLFRERKTVDACERWLEAWAIVRQLARPEHRTADVFAQAYLPLHQLEHWTGALVWELGNAGIDDPANNERQLQFSREYMAQFPDAGPNTVVNQLRAQGEALWHMGRHAEAEATYAALVERLPDEGWGYIGWADQYYQFTKGVPPEYAAAEAILRRALARPALQDREYVLERLADLYGEWGKPAEQARATAQLAKLRQARDRRSSAPVVQAAAQPARTKKPGRNEHCWCGSGRKYKHCHLHADEAR